MPRKDTLASFIAKAVARYGDTFRYDQVRYVDSRTPVIIVCPVHGAFEGIPQEHLQLRWGCPACGKSVRDRKLMANNLTPALLQRRVLGMLRFNAEVAVGLESKYVGSLVGMRRVKSHVGVVEGYRQWQAECTNCGHTLVTTLAQLRLLRKCQRCQGRAQGESGLRDVFRACKNRARQFKRPFGLTLDQVRVLTSQPCHYCGHPPSQLSKADNEWGDYHYNGIDRRDSELGYIDGNCLPCCWPCNRAKADTPYEVFIAYLDRVAAFRTSR